MEEFNFGYESVSYYLDRLSIFNLVQETEEILPTDEHNGGIILKHNHIFISIIMNKLNHFEFSLLTETNLEAFTVVDNGDLLENLLNNISSELFNII